MRSRSTRLLLLALAVLAIGGLLAWLVQKPIAPSDTSAAAGDAPAGLAVETLPETAEPEVPLGQPETALVSNPPTRAAADLPTTVTTLSQPDLPDTFDQDQAVFRQEFEAQRESALAGDDVEAIELGKLINQCQMFFREEKAVSRRVENAATRKQRGRDNSANFRSPTGDTFEHLEDFEQHQWQTFHRCEATRDLVNEDFWERLVRLADSGNPEARYLYATIYKTSFTQVFQFDQWDESLEYSERAYDYTWRNMEEREPLGVLAMAQSQMAGSMFSRGLFSMATVFMTATIKCGLTTPQMNQEMDQLIEMLKRMEEKQPGALEQLNTASNEVKQMFCK